MTPRERVLAIGVGAVVGLFALQYSFTSLRKKLDDKRAQVEAASSELENVQNQIQKGLQLQAKVNSIRHKSLPTNPQLLISQYGDWLTGLAHDAGMEDIKVVKPDPSKPLMNKAAYTNYKFTLSGICRTDQVLDLLGKYYDQDFLHTITSLKLTMDRDRANTIQVHLDSIATSLKIAQPNQKLSDLSSGRLSKSLEEYKQEFIARNPFAPPNNAPDLATSRKQDVKRGLPYSLRLEARDLEGHPVRFELASEVPTGMRFNERSGEFNWQPAENGNYEVVVRAVDSGLPSRSSEHRLAFNVIDPPPPPAKEPEPPKFDPATQTKISALLPSRDGLEVWVRSQTEGKTLYLEEGDEFEIGSIKAKIVSIDLKKGTVELESDGSHRWTLGMDISLSEAFEKSKL